MQNKLFGDYRRKKKNGLKYKIKQSKKFMYMNTKSFFQFFFLKNTVCTFMKILFKNVRFRLYWIDCNLYYITSKTFLLTNFRLHHCRCTHNIISIPTHNYITIEYITSVIRVHCVRTRLIF